MCPNTQFLYISIFVLLIVAAYTYTRLFKAIAANCETFSKLIEAPDKRATFFCTYLCGYYKGRKVEMMCPHFDQGSSREVYVEPKNIPVPQKAFLFSYPHPTADTIWKGKKVFFSEGGKAFRLSESYYKIYREDELQKILESLTEGAYKVETGQLAK